MQEEEDVSNGLLSVATKPSQTGRSEMDPPTQQLSRSETWLERAQQSIVVSLGES